MYLVMYDIRDDKTRTKFSQFLKRYGRRVQFSVFEVDNSPRILDNMLAEIVSKFSKYFEQSDSVLVYDVKDGSCVGKFGFPVNDDTDLLIM